jgi:hypothetical protein
MFKRISLLIVFSLIAGVAFAGAAGLVPIPREEIVFLPGSHNLKDSTGELSAGTISRTSDDMLPDGSGWAWGDRDQLIGTSDQNDDTNWPLTIAVDAGSVYILSTDTSGATVTVAEDTATLDATGSATYGAANAFSFRCTAGGDITLSVSGSSTPRAMLEEVPSDLALGDELLGDPGFEDWDGSDDLQNSWTENSEDANNYFTEHANGVRIVSDNSTAVYLSQPISFTSGETYQFTFVKSDHVSGSIRFSVRNQADDGNLVEATTISSSDADGTYRYFCVSGSTETGTLKIWRDNAGSTDYVMNSTSIQEVPLSVWTDALGPELVVNGDIEEGVPTLSSASINNYAVTSAQSSEQANGGTYSLKVTKTNTTTLAATRFLDNDDMGLEEDVYYQVSIDVYLPSSQTVDTIKLRWQDDDNSNILLDETTTTDSWVTLSGIFKPTNFAGSTTDRILWVQAFNDTVSAEYWYLDNFSIKNSAPSSNPPPTPTPAPSPPRGFTWTGGTTFRIRLC